ncbi:MAG: ComEC/Rec2 family competence protein [Candidatus Omnitrophica bacterium]|nr:ComEC/Rec2 family competence protein [Candidatus Omnitrophota bacterium]
MKRPLVVLTIFFCLGIFAGNGIKVYFLPLYFLSLFLFTLCVMFFSGGRIFSFCLLGLVFLSGAASLKNSSVLPACHPLKLARYSNDYSVKGVVLSKPQPKNDSVSFLFKAQEARAGRRGYKCCGNILVYLPKRHQPRYGEELILKGNLSRPRTFTARRAQICPPILRARFSTRLAINEGYFLKKFSFWAEEKMQGVISKNISGLPAAILSAMVLGEKKDIPASINISMMKSGTVHILVVSGFNVGIAAFIVNLLLKLIRVPRKLRFCLVIFSVVIYCLLTGASNPVLRATVMSVVFLLALLFQREADIYNSCALAALFILLFSPRQLFDPGFQLSFVSVISIIYLYPRIKTLLCATSIKISCIRVLIDGGLVSLSAWLGTMGIVAYYFRILSPVTVLANILIVPLATLITLCGFSLVIVGLIIPPLSPPLACLCSLLVMLLLKINIFMTSLPLAYFYLS